MLRHRVLGEQAVQEREELAEAVGTLLGVQASWPSAVASNPLPPAPMPRVIRPPEMSSREISSLARVTGWRKFGEVTSVPRRSRCVAVAAAVSVGSAPNHVRSRKLRQDRWS